MTNLFDIPPTRQQEEWVEILAQGRDTRIERIVSWGHASQEGFWYDQAQAEWVVLLQGAARLRFENEEHSRELAPGDSVNIPAHCKHRVEWTTGEQPTIWLAIFYDESQ